MSTRSAIAKPESDGWRGRYHHSDGYPTGLGGYLIEAYNGFFCGDLEAMTKFFVDDEKVGWSFVIGTDLSIGPQWLEWDQYPRDERGLTDYSKIGPQSYTARGEMPHSDDPSGDWIVANEDNIFIEWAYVLNAAGLLVVRGTNKPIALVPWDVEEPMKVMDEIEAGTYVSV